MVKHNISKANLVSIHEKIKMEMKNIKLSSTKISIIILTIGFLVGLGIVKLFMTPPSIEEMISNPDWQVPVGIMIVTILVLEDCILLITLIVFTARSNSKIKLIFIIFLLIVIIGTFLYFNNERGGRYRQFDNTKEAW